MSRREALVALCQKHRIDILYVFGSRANEIRKWLDDESISLAAGPSDVDVGVKPDRGAQFYIQEQVRFAVALEDLLSVWRVDLISLPESDPFLAANIVRGERLYARDRYLADEYDLYVLRRAGDLAPLERERIALILRENK